MTRKMGHWNGPVLGLVDLISEHHWEIEPDNSKKKNENGTTKVMRHRNGTAGGAVSHLVDIISEHFHGNVMEHAKCLWSGTVPEVGGHNFGTYFGTLVTASPSSETLTEGPLGVSDVLQWNTGETKANQEREREVSLSKKAPYGTLNGTVE